QQRRVEVAVPAVFRRLARAVVVRAEHRGGQVLADAVLHDLDGPCLEPTAASAYRHVEVRGGLPALDQIGDLLQAAVAVPPQRSGHVGGQPSFSGRAQVGGQDVVIAQISADDRVLPAGDAEGVQVSLPFQ